MLMSEEERGGLMLFFLFFFIIISLFFLPIEGMETKECNYCICFERMGHDGMVMEDVKWIYLFFILITYYNCFL